MNVLVIDDVRTIPGLDATYARTLNEGFYQLSHAVAYDQELDEVYLDWDLGPGVTIKPLIAEIERLAHDGTLLPVKRFVIITANPWGRDWMRKALTPFYDVEVRPMAHPGGAYVGGDNTR